MAIDTTTRHTKKLAKVPRTSPALLRAARQLLKTVNQPTKGETAR